MALTLTCKKHPKYKGIKAPTAKCEACQKLYDLRWVVIEFYAYLGIKVN